MAEIMRILVTGGTGFIGSNLTRKLVNLGHDVVLTGHHAENKVEGIKKFLNTHLTGIDWKALGPIDVVFHQAANNDTLDEDSHEMYLANVEGPRTLFRRAVDAGCNQFVYASSTAVYGDAPTPYVEDNKDYILPLNAYGISKAIFDSFAMDFAEKNDINMVGLRYCNIYGPGEGHKGKRASMIYQIYQTMKTGLRPKLFRDGSQARDWCYVKDAVEANILASKFEGREVFNIGTGNAVSFNDIVAIFQEHMKLGSEFHWPGPLYIDNPYEDKYQARTECCIDKAKKLLGWEPQFDVRKGIEDFLKHLRSQETK
jgi:ADP-L-glycero-D-manno-heptose 6-epimerase